MSPRKRSDTDEPSSMDAGWQTSGNRTEGKHPATMIATPSASRQKSGSKATTDVPSVARAPIGACRMAGLVARQPQEPDKGNR